MNCDSKSSLNQNGIALTIVMLICVALTIASATLFYLTSGFSQSSLLTKLKKQNNYVAELSIKEAKKELISNIISQTHQSIKNEQKIVFNDLQENEKKCLGMSSLSKDFIYFFKHQDISALSDELEKFSYSYWIQKESQKFYLLKTVKFNNQWNDKSEELPEEGLSIIYSPVNYFLDSNLFGGTNQSFTLELWIKTSEGENDIIEILNSLGQRKFKLGRQPGSNHLHASIGPFNFSSSPLEVENDNYHHIVFSWQENIGASFYVDFTNENQSKDFVDTENVLNANLLGGLSRIVIGDNSNLGIVKFRLWNSLRTDEEIIEFASKDIEDDANLLLKYIFDEHSKNLGFIENKLDKNLCESKRCRLQNTDETIWEIVTHKMTIENEIDNENLNFIPATNSSIFSIIGCAFGPRKIVSTTKELIEFNYKEDILGNVIYKNSN